MCVRVCVCACVCVCVCVCVRKCLSVILQKIGPLPLAVEQQLLSELQQLLVALHQERRVIPADCLGAAEEKRQEVRWKKQKAAPTLKLLCFF